MAKNHHKYVHAMPGYGGHVPCMRNHIVGRSFSDSTVRASKTDVALRHDNYASVIPLTVESRPQGRDFLYAQTARTGYENLDRQELVPRPSKRHPPVDQAFASGRVNMELMKKVVGTTEDNVIPTRKSNSMPELAYKNRRLHLHKLREPMYLEAPAIKTIPGYTGHQHAAQHVFSRSYGSLGRELINDGTRPDKPTVHDLLYYWDPRPIGKVLVEKRKIPGYQGFIPFKNNHVYSKTAGRASELTHLAEENLKRKMNASSLPELVDNRPQGGVDLYAQSKEQHQMEESRPILLHTDKARVNVQVFERRPDYKLKEKIQPDMCEVMQGRHAVNGYTGHKHALQHLYGRSYGKLTRALHNKPANPSTSDAVLGFSDTRAMMDQSENLLLP